MTRTCSDCGGEPAHPRVVEQLGLNYCRQCAEKNAHGYVFVVEIDTDKLFARIGRALGEIIIAECSR